MADIELVIKIPEWRYKSICEGVEASKKCGVVGIDPNIHEAIYNGTPLNEVLDKIEAEIKQLPKYGAKFLNGYFTVHIDVDEALQIIDKYRGDA